MAADGEYNHLDVIKSMERAVVSHGKYIEVESEKNIALMRETLRRKYIWIELVETIHCKTKRRVKEEDIENVYDLLKAIREEVAH